MDQVCGWDHDQQKMVVRDCTPEEQAEIDERRARAAAGPTMAEHNAVIIAALIENDQKTIRAVREALISGSMERIEEYEARANELRAQLRKE